MVNHYHVSPNRSGPQLLSGSCLLKRSSGCLTHQSAPVLRPAFLHLFVTISVSLLYPRQVSCNTFYLTGRNLLDRAHGAGKLFRNIWYLPSLTRHWNKIIFILLLHALWSRFVLGLARAAAFPPLCIANGYFGQPELFSRTQLETNEFNSLGKKTPSHDYLVPNWAKDGNDQQKKNICQPY